MVRRAGADDAPAAYHAPMPRLREFLRGPWRAVAVLGVTQILAWGTLFYPPVLTMPLIAADLGWSIAFCMSGLSIGLLSGGLAAPTVGRLIDRYGGGIVMTAGSLVGAAGLFALAHSEPSRGLSRRLGGAGHRALGLAL